METASIFTAIDALRQLHEHQLARVLVGVQELPNTGISGRKRWRRGWNVSCGSGRWGRIGDGQIHSSGIEDARN